jgi:hypothetical protein
MERCLITAGLLRRSAQISKDIEDTFRRGRPTREGSQENTMSLSGNRANCVQARRKDQGTTPAVSPRSRGHTAGDAFLLAVKHGHGDLLPDLNLIRIRDIACSGNVGIMIGRPIKAIANLR